MVATKQKSMLQKITGQQFRTILVIVYFVSILISLIFIIIWTRYEVSTAAEKELSLLVDMVKATRAYIAEDVRPYLLEKQFFHSPAVSSTVATKHIANRFLEAQPQYYIRVVSDNPLNPENQPTAFEEELLKRFRADRNIKNLIEEGLMNNNKYLVSSRPSISRESCLICHGSPQQAPKEIIQKYGTESGYNYAANEVVGASVVGVPINNVNRIVLTRSMIAIGLFSMLFLAIFLTINRLIHQLILKPIVKISRIAREVSQGSLDYSVTSRRKDEIGDLANAFELMRRSLVTASKRIKKLSSKGDVNSKTD